jgi:hypothetical protein
MEKSTNYRLKLVKNKEENLNSDFGEALFLSVNLRRAALIES